MNSGGQDKFERSNINSISAVHAGALEVAKKAQKRIVSLFCLAVMSIEQRSGQT